jgi:BRCT domain type II-containing protein
MELEVINVGSYSEEIKEEKFKPIIERLKNQLNDRKEAYKKKKEEASKKNMLTYTDERLKKSYVAIDQVVEQIDQLLAI